MSKLRILLLADTAPVAEMMLARLAEGGLEAEATRAHGRAEFEAALGAGCRFDLILADYSLPSFDGFSALRLAHEKCPGVPFLFVSGAIGEERAIEMLKSGATDYILKERLQRLVPAVRRALREAAERAERQRLEEALQRRAEELAEAHRRKDEFLSVLSHELRNPLAPVRNALHILRLYGPDDPTVNEARAIIERQVQQLARLVDDLLDVSRIASGKIQVKKQRLDLRAALKVAVESARPLVEKRRHRLEVSLPDEPLRLEADPVRLGQIVTNILNNAAKYTDRAARSG